MKKIILLMILLLLLNGCQPMRKLKIDTVNDYLDKQVNLNECVKRIEAKHVNGFVNFRYYFYEDCSQEFKQDVIDESLVYFSLPEIQMKIREYYSKKHNSGKLYRQSPTITIEIYNENSVQPLYSYENELKYRKTEKNGMQALYGEWSEH